jgi:hypothetical protein
VLTYQVYEVLVAMLVVFRFALTITHRQDKVPLSIHCSPLVVPPMMRWPSLDTRASTRCFSAFFHREEIPSLCKHYKL